MTNKLSHRSFFMGISGKDLLKLIPFMKKPIQINKKMKTTSKERKLSLQNIMKYSCLTFAILCIFCSSLLASPIMAQGLANRKINIQINKGQKITSIIKEIENTTGIRFVYNPDLLQEKNSFLSGDYQQEPLRSMFDRLGINAIEKEGYVILDNITYQKADRIITGVVKDTTGLALPGVSVKVLGTPSGTVTDSKGAYRIEVGPDAVLSFSMIGFRTQEVRVGASQVVNVTLSEEMSKLAEVVVVGYGTQKKETLTGAVSIVSLDKLGSRSLNSVGEVLAGKSPGVIVSNEGGDPTSAPRVNIRGLGGINGESVLYVIDGSIYSGTPQINANDIESISVLKDASAAIYGARASGGVVLITTKKGKNGQMRISFDAKVGQQSAWKKLEPLNAEQRAQVAATAAKNGGTTILPAFDPAKYPDGQTTRTNWMDEVFRDGLLQDYNAAINGGSEKSNYYLSFNYRNAEGIVLNTKTKRYNFRINSEHELNSWLKLGENLSYSSTNGNGANTSSDYTGALLSAIYYPRNGTPYNADGSFAGLPGGQYAGDYGDIVNPVAELQRIDINNPVNVLVINPYATLNLAKGLSFRSNLSITKSSSQFKSFTPKRPEVGKPVLSNSLQERADQATDLLAEQILSYKTTFGDHHLDFTGGYTFQQTKSNGLYVTGSGFDDESPQYRYLVNATIIQPSTSYMSETALSSILLRANYNYKEKYLVSLIGRRDGSSMLTKENRFRNYGSVSLGWAVNKETFLKDVQWLNELKLRGSYGILGNLGSLSQSAVNPLLTATQSYFGQSPVLQNGYVLTTLANRNLTWAESKQTNIGMDLTVLNRLSLVADYFVKETDKMILTRSLPGTAGLSTQTINAGLVKDKGIELGLTYNSDKSKAFTYSVNATLTKLKNNVEELAPGLQNIAVGTNFRNELAPLSINVGQPLYSYYVLKTEGIFQTQAEVDNYKNSKGQKIQPNAKPGDFRFADLDDSGAIDGKDRYFAGSAYPDFSYGLSFNASYKNFDFNIFAQGVQGNKLFNAVKRTTYSASGPSYNKLVGILDAWSTTNPNGKVPIISTSDNNGNFNASDFYVENGSYLRIRNVTLGYSLPKSLTEKLKTAGLRIYATANNLFTITKYSGFDPEIGMDNNGLDVGRYPQARSFILGINVNL
ncbi:TonB-linked outer membrane protein, SusC/RagA family [Pedobacter rhizosphaerae]|uniref:TonB-linked outer membrane protein, SusC/RagA family n=2 Tax=Pedobacter rhizosphaerae TaxID=390241 RepID=A0A1H9MPX2_9SPHI|nr:TonB-linked outer membrane protein, SusC/RagA family [Pedobacter rhizosphaerae]